MNRNGHYVIAPDGKQVYFIDIVSNKTFYALTVRLYSVSKYMYFNGTRYDIESESSNSYRIPRLNSNLSFKPPPENVYETPQIIIPSNNNFGLLLGFNKNQTLLYDT